MKRYIFPKRFFKEKREIVLKNLAKRKPLQIGLTEKDTVFFVDGDHIILDFGVEICGGIRILTYKANNIPVRIRFGESITECCAELGDTTNATNDHSLRDMTVCLQNYSDMHFGQTGFRFVRMDFAGQVEIKSIVASSEYPQKTVKYKYCGQDKEISKIYEVAKRTVELCITSGYVWDGIKRDRLVWIGDMHPEMLALTTLYGRTKEVEKSLDFVKNQTPLPGWMNRFPVYSMWWIIIVADYYDRTGAQVFTSRQIGYLKNLLKQMDSCILPDGDMNYPFYFVDWPTRNEPDEIIGARAINVMAMKKAIFLLNAFGESTRLAEELLERLLKQPINPIKRKQVIALKYFATGKLSEEEKEKLISGGAKGM